MSTQIPLKKNTSHKYIDEAMKLHEMGNIEDAIDDLLIAKSLNPRKMEIGKKLASIYLSAGSIQLALDELRILWLQNPNSEEIILEIAELYVQSSQASKAGEFYNRALQINPSNQDVLVVYGKLLFDLEEYQEALKIFERLKYLQIDNAEVLLSLADCYLKLDRNIKAIEHLKMAFKLAPHLKKLRIQLATVYIKEELYDGGLQLLKDLQEDQGLSLQEYILMIDALMGQKNYHQAQELINHCKEEYPKETILLKKSITLKKKLNLLDEVMNDYGFLLDQEQSLENIQDFCSFLEETDQYNHLQKVLVEINLDEESNAWANLKLAFLCKLDNPEYALECLNKALPFYSKDEDLHLLKGEILISLNYYAKATQWFEKLKDKFPGSEYDYKLQELIQKDKAYKETFSVLKKARAALESGHYKKALRYYEEIVEKVPDNRDWLEQLGSLYSYDTNYISAMESYDKALIYSRDDQKEELFGNQILLSTLYDDFSRTVELVDELSQVSTLQFYQKLQQIRAYRHLLAERSRDTEFFSSLLIQYQKQEKISLQLEDSLLCGYAYLYLGSHLLNVDDWVSGASKMFNKVISRTSEIALHPSAYEGLYLVAMLNSNQDKLISILREWIKVDAREKTKELYLQELSRLKLYKEALIFLQEEVKANPENLKWRVYKLNFAYTSWAHLDNKHIRINQSIKQLMSNCAQTGGKDSLAYFDLSMAYLIFTADRPSAEFLSRAQQALKKAIRLDSTLIEFHEYMLLCFDYEGKLEKIRPEWVNSKKKVYLEKHISLSPIADRLLMKLGILLLNQNEDHDNGRKYLMKSITLNPDLTEIDYYLGNYFFKESMMKPSYHHYLKFIEQAIPYVQWSQVKENMQRIL
ncbi:MAG: tetratricopeptide repeat protein [Candidatus Cloacimonetes bacterium]|nr:tetratricopeptide repeat protein [Candidatus Cloacimonadota bacterium]